MHRSMRSSENPHPAWPVRVTDVPLAKAAEQTPPPPLIPAGVLVMFPLPVGNHGCHTVNGPLMSLRQRLLVGLHASSSVTVSVPCERHWLVEVGDIDAYS
jgi:hypothetical protein